MTAALLLLSHAGSAQHQESVYEIIRNNKTIGTVEACSVQSEKQMNYSVETHVTLSLFIDIKVDMRISSTYLSGELTEASVLKIVNGSTKTNNRIVKHGSQYEFVNKEGNISYCNCSIYSSISALYFSEPVSLQKIFSENFLDAVPIKNISKENYMLELPDGHKNYYRYQNGICREVEMETPLSTVFLRLKSTSLKP